MKNIFTLILFSCLFNLAIARHIPLNKLNIENIITCTKTEGNWSINANQQIELQLFPNPVIDRLNITGTHNTGRKYTVKLYSLLGKEYYQKEYKCDDGKIDVRLDVSGLKQGAYFVTVDNKVTKRFVKR